MNAKRPFKVGLTRDFLTPDGQLTYEDIGLSILDAEPNIVYEFFPEHYSPVEAAQLRNYDAIISLAPKYTPESFAGAENLLAIVRCGVGYDMVDVNACTTNGTLLSITSGAVNHSVAEAIIGWMLALSHRMKEKDRLVREGGWANRSHYMGSELRDKTVGVIGLGGIGGCLIEMLRGFGIKPPLVYDPFVDKARVEQLNGRVASLEEVMSGADFVSINCPLNDKTRGLIGYEQLSLMKPTAYLINTARGGIVDEDALLKLLQEERIAGLATDVFADEPVSPDNPLLKNENALLAPHCIAWTHELFRDMGIMACQQVVSLSRGEIPPSVVNRDVLDQPNFQKKLKIFVPPTLPLSTRPPEMEPDRLEVIGGTEAATYIEIASGVELRLLVGKHNHARNLTTGIVTIQPRTTLPCHTHTFSESISVLSGEITLEAEGREYSLSSLDNAVIPPGVAHSVINPSSAQTALLHVALASDTPSRDLVTSPFAKKKMSEESSGEIGKERINRHALTPSYQPNPGANFKDWFNLNMGCTEMSGGYGIFEPGAQLPCHIHDFDESITIIQGNATCLVEGRKYQLSNNETALVPRGRCHYFINNSDEPMAMIWVYAGPTPERMVMESSLCDVPWSK